MPSVPISFGTLGEVGGEEISQRVQPQCVIHSGKDGWMDEWVDRRKDKCTNRPLMLLTRTKGSGLTCWKILMRILSSSFSELGE